MPFTEDLNLELLTDGQDDARDALNTRIAEVLDKGYTRKRKLGEAFTDSFVGYLDPATNKVKKAKADDEATARVEGIGFCTLSGVLDDDRLFRYFGRITLSDWTNVAGAATLTAGARYYLSDATAGMITDTKPTAATSFVIQVGVAKDTTTLDIVLIEAIEGTGGGGVVDALVPDDYDTLGEACAGEKAGAIIGIKEGVYTEIQDVTIKQGQTIFAMGGVSDLSATVPTSDASVVVDMGDYQLLAPNAGFRLEGVYFTWVSTTDEDKIQISNDRGVIRNCTFDLSGTVSACTGMQVQVSAEYFTMDTVRFIGSSSTRSLLFNDGDYCTYRNLEFSGGNLTATDQIIESGNYNLWDNVLITDPDTAVTGEYYFIISGNNNTLSRLRIIIAGSVAADGLAVIGSNNYITGYYVTGGNGLDGIVNSGSYNIYDGFNITGTLNGTAIRTSGGSKCRFQNGVISGAFGIIPSGNQPDIVFDNIIFLSIQSTYDIDGANQPARWHLSNLTLDNGLRVGGDNWTISDIKASTTPVQGIAISATANGTILSNVQDNITILDSGTGTVYNAKIHKATADPTVNNDSSEGFQIGDLWINSSTPQVFYASSVGVGTATWNDIAGNPDPAIKTYSVSNQAEFRAALADLQSTPGVVKGIITLTADIVTGGALSPDDIDKDLVIQSDSSKRTITRSNGFQLDYSGFGNVVEFRNLIFDGGSTSGNFIRLNSGTGIDSEKELTVRWINCKITSTTGSEPWNHQNNMGRLKVEFIESEWDSNNQATYLLEGRGSDAHIGESRVELHAIGSRLDGRIIDKGGVDPLSAFARIEGCIITNSDGNGCWLNTLDGTEDPAPSGQFVVYYDTISQMDKTLVAGSDPISFQTIGSDGAHTKTYSVATDQEFQDALEDLRDSEWVDKGIINITADINLTAGRGVMLNKDIHIRGFASDNTRYILTTQNSFEIGFNRSGHFAQMSNLTFRPIGTNNVFHASNDGSTSFRRVTLKAQFNNVVIDVDNGSSPSNSMVSYGYYSTVDVEFNLCSWINTVPRSFRAVGVKTSAYNNSQYDPKGATVRCYDCKIDGRFMQRTTDNNSFTVELYRCKVEDTGAVGVWECDLAGGGSATKLNGKLTVLYDANTEMDKSLIPGGTSSPDFRLIGSYFTEILVDPTAVSSADGLVYPTVEEAVEYTQANASLAPFVINIAAGEYLIERSLILDTVGVSFKGAGKDKTILTFDRTNEDATNYWIRTTTTVDAQYSPRICFAMCGYTDQTTYGLLASSVTWTGHWYIKDLTIECTYSGDNTSIHALIPVYHRPAGVDSSWFDIIDVDFRNKNAPAQVFNGAVETNPIIHHDVEGSPTWGTNTANVSREINIHRCNFTGVQTMAGTVSITASTSALTGVGTAFSTELTVGAGIMIEQRTYEIASITDDTNATIVGTADQTATSEVAVAIHPWLRGIYINTHELSSDPIVSIKDCDFIWVMGQVIYSYSNDFLMDGCRTYNCGMNGGSAAGGDSVISWFNKGKISNHYAEMYAYLAKVFTSGNRPYFGSWGSADISLSNIEMVNGSNTFALYACALFTDKVVKAVNCNFGVGSYFGNTEGVWLSGANCSGSSFTNCSFDGSVDAFYCDTNTDDIKFTNCRFFEEVYIGATVEEVKFIGSYFEKELTILGDKFAISACEFDGVVDIDNSGSIAGSVIQTLEMANGSLRISNSRIIGTASIANTTTKFRASNCIFDVAQNWSSLSEVLYFNSCQFDGVITLPGTTSRANFSYCFFAAAPAISGLQHIFTGCQFDTSITLTCDDCYFHGCFFGVLTISSGADDNQFIHCVHAGGINDNGARTTYMCRTKGEIYDEDDATAVTIDKQNSWQAITTLASSAHLIGTSLISGITVAVSGAYADAGGGDVTVTAAAHGLSNGDPVTISGSTNYDGAYIISNVTTNTFDITATYVAEGAAGNVRRPSALKIDTTELEAKGVFKILGIISSSQDATNKVLQYALYVNATRHVGALTERNFSINDVGAMSVGGLIDLNPGDFIWLAVRCLTATPPAVTNKHVNLSFSK